MDEARWHNTVVDEREHSRFGASRADIWTVCTAMPLYCETIPPMPPSDDMKEGTAAHEVIKLCITQGFDPIEMVSRFIKGVEVTPEMAEHVERFVARARDHIRAGHKIFVEHRFNLSAFDDELFGTCDLVSYDAMNRLLYVDDFKYGAGIPVKSKDNLQASIYGLGAFMSLDAPIEKVILRIDQPRVGSGDVVPWEISPGELFEKGGELADIVTVARSGERKFVPGPHCQFCPGRGSCDALHSAALAAAGADVEPNNGDFLAPPEPETLSLDELGQRLKQADIIRTWLNGVEAFADAEMRRGRIATGFKMVKSLGNRKWTDAELALAQAARVFVGSVIEEDLYTRKPISPAQLEKLVGKKHAAEFVDAYTTRPEGYALAKLSDKRPAVTQDALSEFEPIGEATNVDN